MMVAVAPQCYRDNFKKTIAGNLERRQPADMISNKKRVDKTSPVIYSIVDFIRKIQEDTINGKGRHFGSGAR